MYSRVEQLHVQIATKLLIARVQLSLQSPSLCAQALESFQTRALAEFGCSAGLGLGRNFARESRKSLHANKDDHRTVEIKGLGLAWSLGLQDGSSD